MRYDSAGLLSTRGVTSTRTRPTTPLALDRQYRPFTPDCRTRINRRRLLVGLMTAGVGIRRLTHAVGLLIGAGVGDAFIRSAADGERRLSPSPVARHLRGHGRRPRTRATGASLPTSSGIPAAADIPISAGIPAHAGSPAGASLPGRRQHSHQRQHPHQRQQLDRRRSRPARAPRPGPTSRPPLSPPPPSFPTSADIPTNVGIPVGASVPDGQDDSGDQQTVA